MTARQQLAADLLQLSDRDIDRVGRFIRFLKSKPLSASNASLDAATMQALYADAGDEDRRLAQEGMTDYTKGLRREDGQ